MSVEKLYKRTAQELLEDGMLKKIFVLPGCESLLEFYVDSATCEQVVIEWMEQEDPNVFRLDREEDWPKYWKLYIQNGKVYKSSRKEQDYVEHRKNECIQKGAPTKELVYWTRYWEAVKFIRKDRRLK